MAQGDFADVFALWDKAASDQRETSERRDQFCSRMLMTALYGEACRFVDEARSHGHRVQLDCDGASDAFSLSAGAVVVEFERRPDRVMVVASSTFTDLLLELEPQVTLEGLRAQAHDAVAQAAAHLARHAS